MIWPVISKRSGRCAVKEELGYPPLPRSSRFLKFKNSVYFGFWARGERISDRSARGGETQNWPKTLKILFLARRRRRQSPFFNSKRNFPLISDVFGPKTSKFSLSSRWDPGGRELWALSQGGRGPPAPPAGGESINTDNNTQPTLVYNFKGERSFGPDLLVVLSTECRFVRGRHPGKSAFPIHVLMLAFVQLWDTRRKSNFAFFELSGRNRKSAFRMFDYSNLDFGVWQNIFGTDFVIE